MFALSVSTPTRTAITGWFTHHAAKNLLMLVFFWKFDAVLGKPHDCMEDLTGDTMAELESEVLKRQDLKRRGQDMPFLNGSHSPWLRREYHHHKCFGDCSGIGLLICWPEFFLQFCCWFLGCGWAGCFTQIAFDQVNIKEVKPWVLGFGQQCQTHICAERRWMEEPWKHLRMLQSPIRLCKCLEKEGAPIHLLRGFLPLMGLTNAELMIFPPVSGSRSWTHLRGIESLRSKCGLMILNSKSFECCSWKWILLSAAVGSGFHVWPWEQTLLYIFALEWNERPRWSSRRAVCPWRLQKWMLPTHFYFPHILISQSPSISGT